VVIAAEDVGKMVAQGEHEVDTSGRLFFNRRE
jgi:hypothetical protein